MKIDAVTSAAAALDPVRLRPARARRARAPVAGHRLSPRGPTVVALAVRLPLPELVPAVGVVVVLDGPTVIQETLPRPSHSTKVSSPVAAS